MSTIDFAILVCLFVIVPAFPVWLFLRQRTELVRRETENNPNVIDVVIYITSSVAALDVLSQQITTFQLIIVSTALSISWILYPLTSAKLSDTGKQALKKVNVATTIVFLLAALTFVLRRWP